MTNAIVDWRKQHPQQMTTIMGTLEGFIGDAYWIIRLLVVHFKSIYSQLTLKLFFTNSTTKVPETGQIHLVKLSIRFSVIHKSVLHVGSKVAFESNLNEQMNEFFQMSIKSSFNITRRTSNSPTKRYPFIVWRTFMLENNFNMSRVQG